jgi:hypothetical protein
MSAHRQWAAPEWLIAVGSAFFILTLAVSAAFVPELRWLHLVQAIMYVGVVSLSMRQRSWGYFLGASVAGFWDVVALFGSPLFAEMFAQFRPDLVLQGLAWLANLAVVVGSVLGYRRLAAKSSGDVGRFAFVFVAATGFLVGATALLAPSYLANLAGILHPHWPWMRA